MLSLRRNTLPSSVDKVRLHSIDVACLKVSCACAIVRATAGACFHHVFRCNILLLHRNDLRLRLNKLRLRLRCFHCRKFNIRTAKLDRTSFLSSPHCKTDQTRRKTMSRLPNSMKHALALATRSATNQLLQIVVHGDIIRKIF